MDAAFIWKLSKLGRIGSSRVRLDDDFADRLNYQYSGVLLFLFIGLIGIRQYVGKPIQCWIPQEFTRGWEEYAENYCWVANTYFAVLSKRLPLAPDRNRSQLVYYQWAPIVLATQALLFYLPCLIWRLGVHHSGFNVHRVLQLAADANELVPETASKTVHLMARYLETCIQCQKMRRLNSNDRRSSDIYRRTQSAQNVDIKSKQQSEHNLKMEFEKENKPYVSESFSHRNSDNYSKGIVDKSTLKPDIEISSDKPKFRRPPPPPPPRSSHSEVIHFDTDRELTPTSTVQPREIPHGFAPKETILLIDSKLQIARPHSWSIFKGLCPWSRKPSLASPSGIEYRGKKIFAFSNCCGTKKGNFLMSLYITVKFMYLVNSVGQIYLMENFVGSNMSFYGARVLIDLIRGHDWQESGHFPRVTFCDLEAKKLGKNHIYTMQCVLPLNMFLEKIYIFLWFWHSTISIVTLVSLINWMRRLFIGQLRLKFIRRYLKVMNMLPSKLDSRMRARTRQFVEEYLTADCLFLLRLISTNSGHLLAGDLTCELWCSFLFRNQIAQPCHLRSATSCPYPVVPCSHYTTKDAEFGTSSSQQPLRRACNCENCHSCQMPHPPDTLYSCSNYKPDFRKAADKPFYARSPKQYFPNIMRMQGIHSDFGCKYKSYNNYDTNANMCLLNISRPKEPCHSQFPEASKSSFMEEVSAPTYNNNANGNAEDIV